MLARFDWDPDKASRNYRKHGVDFETARLVFADQHALTIFDRFIGAEQRWHTLGMVEGSLLLLVVHTICDMNEGGLFGEIIRIISARPATRKERWRYEQEVR